MATEKKETKKTTETKAKTSRAKKTAPKVEEIVTASEPEEKIIPEEIIEEKPEDIQEPAKKNDLDGVAFTMTVKVKTRLNVRAGASKEAKIIRQLPDGAKVPVFEIKDGWARIGDGEWAMADYLK